jgi:hypothetical protein
MIFTVSIWASTCLRYVIISPLKIPNVIEWKEFIFCMSGVIVFDSEGNFPAGFLEDKDAPRAILNALLVHDLVEMIIMQLFLMF